MVRGAAHNGTIDGMLGTLQMVCTDCEGAS